MIFHAALNPKLLWRCDVRSERARVVAVESENGL